jgi:hypothetical protein
MCCRRWIELLPHRWKVFIRIGDAGSRNWGCPAHAVTRTLLGQEAVIRSGRRRRGATWHPRPRRRQGRPCRRCRRRSAHGALQRSTRRHRARAPIDHLACWPARAGERWPRPLRRWSGAGPAGGGTARAAGRPRYAGRPAGLSASARRSSWWRCSCAMRVVQPDEGPAVRRQHQRVRPAAPQRRDRRPGTAPAGWTRARCAHADVGGNARQHHVARQQHAAPAHAGHVLGRVAVADDAGPVFAADVQHLAVHQPVVARAGRHQAARSGRAVLAHLGQRVGVDQPVAGGRSAPPRRHRRRWC